MRNRLLRKISWSQVALAIILIGFVGVVTASVNQEPRGADGCPASGPDGGDVFLFDASDPTVESQLKELRSRFFTVVRSLDSRTRLSVFVFGGGEEADLVSLPLGCNAMADPDPLRGIVWGQKEEARFFGEVEAAIESLKSSRRGNSPIFEGVMRLLFNSQLFEGQGTRLHVFSDLIQNTPAWSHFPENASYRAPEEGLCPALDELPEREFREITLYEIQRPQWRALQRPAVGKWWISCLQAVSSTTPVLEKL